MVESHVRIVSTTGEVDVAPAHRVSVKKKPVKHGDGWQRSALVTRGLGGDSYWITKEEYDRLEAMLMNPLRKLNAEEQWAVEAVREA